MPAIGAACLVHDAGGCALQVVWGEVVEACEAGTPQDERPDTGRGGDGFAPLEQVRVTARVAGLAEERVVVSERASECIRVLGEVLTDYGDEGGSCGGGA